MTGEPDFTFRDSGDVPECRNCGDDMVFLRTYQNTFNERDIYGCNTCGKVLEDRWTF